MAEIKNATLTETHARCAPVLKGHYGEKPEVDVVDLMKFNELIQLRQRIHEDNEEERLPFREAFRMVVQDALLGKCQIAPDGEYARMTQTSINEFNRSFEEDYADAPEFYNKQLNAYYPDTANADREIKGLE